MSNYNSQDSYENIDPIDLGAISGYSERELIFSLLNNENTDDLFNLLPSAASDPTNDVLRPLMNATTLYQQAKKEQIPFQPSLVSLEPFPTSTYTSNYPPRASENSDFFSSSNGTTPISQSTNLGIETPVFSAPSSITVSPEISLQQEYYQQQQKEFEDQNPQSQLKQSKSANKRQKGTEDKEYVRAEQQRAASRRYRQKKKILVEQLESKLKEIMTEKQRIEQEHRDTLEIVNNLKKENESLRKSHFQDSEKIQKDRMEVLKQLEALVQRGATDEEILPYVNTLSGYCKQISSIGECHANLLLNPSVVCHLAKSGFFENANVPSVCASNEGTITCFGNKVLKFVKTLTEEQKDKIKKIVTSAEKELEPIKIEREHLNQEITAYFSQQNPTIVAKKEGDMSMLIQAMSTLEYLRKNVTAEMNKCSATFGQIMSQLTPRQRAQFYLDVEFQHNSVIQLKSMWDVFSKHAVCPKQGLMLQGSL